MISDVPQHDDADFSAAVSNDTIAGSSANDAWDSVQTVSHAMQDVALKASDSPMIGSFESDKTPMEFKLQDKISSPHFAVPEGRIFLDICSMPPAMPRNEPNEKSSQNVHRRLEHLLTDTTKGSTNF